MIQKIVGVILCCGIDVAALSGSEPVLDQFNMVTHSPGGEQAAFNISRNFSVGQVITSGLTGQLAKIDLGIFRNSLMGSDPLFVDIVRTVNGWPDFSAAGRLATRVIERSTVPLGSTFPHFNRTLDLTDANLHFASQEKFAIVLRSDIESPNSFLWWKNLDATDTYPGGSNIQLPRATNIAIDWHSDTQFRTYVRIPEPSCLTAAAFGCPFIFRLRARGRPFMALLAA